MFENNIIPIRQQPEAVSRQPVGIPAKKPVRKHVSSATTLNRHIRAAVIRLLVDSPLDINRFSTLAKYAGTKESIALDVVREEFRKLRTGPMPTPPGAAMRRAA